MKKFNRMIAFALLTAVAHVSVTQCMDADKKAVRNIREYELRKKGLLGLTGFSVVSWGAKKIFNNLSESNPTKKEQYLKYARYSRNVSRVAASPAIGLMTVCGAAMASLPFSSKFIVEPLVAIAKLSLVPYEVMIAKPVEAYLDRQN